jgi:hypothetical protein
VNIRGELSNNLMLCVSAWFGVLFLFSKQQASILGNSRLGRSAGFAIVQMDVSAEAVYIAGQATHGT